MKPTAAQIHWYNGYTCYDQPRRLFWGGRWLAITAVLSRRAFPEGACWHVLAADGRRYRLDYQRPQDTWEVCPAG